MHQHSFESCGIFLFFTVYIRRHYQCTSSATRLHLAHLSVSRKCVKVKVVSTRVSHSNIISYLRVTHSQWTEVKRRREGGIANTNTKTSSLMILGRKLMHVHQWKEIATWNLDVYQELDCSA